MYLEEDGMAVRQTAKGGDPAIQQDLWQWHTQEPGLLPHWKSTRGNVVRLFPPLLELHAWQVVVYDTPGVIAVSQEITGDDAERRAFVVGEVYVTQDRRKP